MTIHYFVRNHNCPEKKTYLIRNKNLSYIRGYFKLNNDSYTYSIKDVEVEPDNLGIYVPIFIFVFIGFLIAPLGGIIGAMIGLVIGYSQVRIDELQLKRAKEILERLKNYEKI